MALMLAPYNSAMRLGMGFNSYTQTLCVNDAVQKPGGMPASESDLKVSKTIESSNPNPEITGPLQGASGTMTRTMKDGQKEISQTVSWKAKFVDDVSEVVKALDVSGSLEIKAQGIGSLKGSVQFADTDEMKRADVKYFLQVKVVNQRLIADDVIEFSPIDNVQPGDFNDIYGDCFISGFIEGGEFNALITITTAETLKKFHLGGSLSLEASLAGGAVDVKGTASGSKDDNEMSKKSRTVINVSWAGGGDIKPDKVENWDAASLKQVAMEFPDNVAWCPQRTKAILTKYTQLRSFHEKTKKGSPLDYENAGIYTASLLNAYTDYQLLWKMVQNMTVELNDENKRTTFIKQEISSSLSKFAESYRAVQDEKEKEYKRLIEAPSPPANSTALVLAKQRNLTVAKIPEKPLPCNDFLAYEGDIFGLEKASRDCRFEMIKIVREVDEVSQDPKVATDPNRTWQYLAPNIFKCLLPKVDSGPPLPGRAEWDKHLKEAKTKAKLLKEREAEIEQIKKSLEESLITPVTPVSRSRLFTPMAGRALHDKLAESIRKCSSMANNYRMDAYVGQTQDASSKATFFNDLETLKPGRRPEALSTWTKGGKLTGVRVKYTNDYVLQHGATDGDSTGWISLSKDGSETITEIQIYEAKDGDGVTSLATLAAATSACAVMKPAQVAVERKHHFSMTDDKQWSFAGFYGFEADGRIQTLGVVWSRLPSAAVQVADDKPVTAPPSRVLLPPAKNFLDLPQELQDKTRKVMDTSATTHPSEHFYIGDSITTTASVPVGSADPKPVSFNALDDIKGDWKIKNLAFAASASTKYQLGGLKVTYDNGKYLTFGEYSDQDKSWECTVETPIIAAKVTVGKHANSPATFVNTVELVRGDAAGNMPDWVLDVATIRYIGTGDLPIEPVGSLIDSAPVLGAANWSLRGFYGESAGWAITRLGMIWGCA